MEAYLDYAKVDDHELNKITSLKMGKLLTLPYCGDIGLAIRLVYGMRWNVGYNGKDCYAHLESGDEPYLSISRTPARALVVVWNLWYDNKGK